MGWVKEALAELSLGRTVQIRPRGGSMRGRIEDGALVTLASVAGRALHVNDIVLVRWKSNYLLHLIKDIADGRYLIGNNRGHINGWVDLSDIVAVVVEEAPETIECSPKPIS